MNNDDSFNDSDEVFNLYSAKKVTEVFQTQLQTIISSNYKEGNVVTNTDSDKDNNKKGKKKETSGNKGRTKKENAYVQDGAHVEIIDCVLDDSVEILVPDVTSNGTRKSERLRRTRGGNTHVESDLDSPVVGRPGRRRKSVGRRGRTRKTKPVIEEVIIDSPQPADSLEDEVNPEVSVKVIWKSVNVKKFQIRKFQKLSKVFQQISEQESIPEDKIILTFNGVRVNRNDTPDSLNLQVYHFLDGGVLSELLNSCESLDADGPRDDDSLNLKFQDANKKIVNVRLNKNDKVKVAMIKCSEQIEIPLARIKFFFDGDPLEPSETPHSLGLENDEIIDVKILS